MKTTKETYICNDCKHESQHFWTNEETIHCVPCGSKNIKIIQWFSESEYNELKEIYELTKVSHTEMCETVIRLRKYIEKQYDVEQLQKELIGINNNYYKIYPNRPYTKDGVNKLIEKTINNFKGK